VLALPILSAAAPRGIEALAVGVVVIAAIDFLPLHLVLVRLLGVEVRGVVRALARPAFLSLAAGSITWVAAQPLADRPLLALGCGGFVFAASYAALLGVLARAELTDLRRLLAGNSVAATELARN
jgi:hypothetical protein